MFDRPIEMHAKRTSGAAVSTCKPNLNGPEPPLLPFSLFTDFLILEPKAWAGFLIIGPNF